MLSPFHPYTQEGTGSITEPWHSQYIAELRLELHSLALNSVLLGRENNLE